MIHQFVTADRRGQRLSWLSVAVAAAVLLGWSSAGMTRCVAQQDVVEPAQADSSLGLDGQTESQVPNPFKELVTADMKRLSESASVWISAEENELYVLGAVTARAAPLEMFACPRGTKEYESVVAVDSTAQLVHTGLLAIGAQPGSPMQFDPKYIAASGAIIEITVQWFEGETLRSTRAQNWVRDVSTGKALEHDWVFGGSGFWEDPESGERFYRAEGGELICVSNFSTATMDLPIASTQDNTELVFDAFTENIPALGTPVRLVLKPEAEK